MHFVTGGAYNGKKKWVMDYYKEQTGTNSYWLSCYHIPIKEKLHTFNLMKNKLIILEGIDCELERALKSEASLTAALFFEQYLSPLMRWESKAPDNKLVIIGTDISKGIVPVDKESRRIRDETGRLFQTLTKYAEDVHIVWFGIANSIGRGLIQ